MGVQWSSRSQLFNFIFACSEEACGKFSRAFSLAFCFRRLLVHDTHLLCLNFGHNCILDLFDCLVIKITQFLPSFVVAMQKIRFASSKRHNITFSKLNAPGRLFGAKKSSLKCHFPNKRPGRHFGKLRVLYIYIYIKCKNNQHLYFSLQSFF